MSKIEYIRKQFSQSSQNAIAQVNEIMESYAAQGYDLTLRQLYYQFVSSGLISNRDSEYKCLGPLITDAGLAGLIDWDHIVDRTRHVRQNSHWSKPSSIIDWAATSYSNDKWAEQAYRGYTSQTEIRSAAQR